MSNARDKANIPVLNFQSKGIDDNATSTVLTITSGTDVQIGSTNSGVGGTIDLSIGNTSSSGGITLWSTTTSSHSIGFADGYTGTDRYRGYLEYTHSGDSMRFGTASSEKMRLNSTGLGIGTSSPLATLHVDTSNSAVAPNAEADDFFVEGNSHSGITIGSGSSHRSSIYFANSSDNDIARIVVSHAEGSMRFNNNASERMRITSGGNLIIGDTTEADARTGKLKVRNDVDYSSTEFEDDATILVQNETNNNSASIVFHSNNASGSSKRSAIIGGFIKDTDTAIGFYGAIENKTTSSNPDVIINSSGQVGIGTSSPSKPLEIVSSAQTTLLHLNSTAGTTSAITFENTGSNDSITIGAENDDLKLRTDDGVIKFFTNENSEKMRIDSSGNVGIGTTSPTPPTAYGGLHINSQYPVLKLSSTTSGTGVADGFTVRINSADDAQLWHYENKNMSFATNNAERMRITSDGRFGMNGRTNPQYTLEFGDSGTGNGWSINAENNVHKIRTRASAGDTQTHVQWENTNGIVGSVKTNGSATQYNTSSDYRLKENVSYDFDATTRLKQLKPARFNFIADDTDTLVDGFIAHEVSTIVPEAVSGAKDSMFAEVLYEEGDELPEGKNVGDVKTSAQIDPQGIDQSKLVPLLVKTIQELEARITTLEANNP
ncbi:hypothetical protein HTVC134P_gp40 [Pelagibacter phage HTVC134P]|nr:hypothetical protein HTVC134P_gp40 [Pelagibacter phage HTVC134P]